MTQDLLQFPPPLSREQSLARQREERVLSEQYSGKYVAYVDDWSGSSLTRTVVGVASEPNEFQRLLANLPQDVRTRTQLTRIPDPDCISIPFCRLA